MGEEVFVVLDGVVDMHVREPEGHERIIPLEPGDILHIREGEGSTRASAGSEPGAPGA